MDWFRIISNRKENLKNNIFFVNSFGEEKKVSYEAIFKKSKKMLGYLQSKGIKGSVALAI